MSSEVVLRSLHIWRDLTRKFSPKHWPNIIYLEFNSWYDKTPSKDDAAIIFKKISIVASTLDTDDERTMVTGPRRLVEIQKIIQKTSWSAPKQALGWYPYKLEKNKTNKHFEKVTLNCHTLDASIVIKNRCIFNEKPAEGTLTTSVPKKIQRAINECVGKSHKNQNSQKLIIISMPG